MPMRYYAIKPKSHGPASARIEKASTPQAAADMAFGRGCCSVLPGLPAVFHYKDLGSRLSPLQNDRKRIELLTSADGWVDL